MTFLYQQMHDYSYVFIGTFTPVNIQVNKLVTMLRRKLSRRQLNVENKDIGKLDGGFVCE